MSLFSIVQGRTPPVPQPAPAAAPQPPMPVAPAPTSPANAYAPMGANIPAPPQLPPVGVAPPPAPAGAPAAPAPMAGPPAGGNMAPAPAQFPPPALMANIPGRADGGVVSVPGYGGGTDTGWSPPASDGGGGDYSQGSDQFYQQNSGLDVNAWNQLSPASKDMYVAAINKKFYGNASGPKSADSMTPGESAQVGLGYAQLSQKALTDQQARDDAWAKMIEENKIAQQQAQADFEKTQAAAAASKRSDEGTLGLKAFDSALAAARQSGGTYGEPTGAGPATWQGPTYSFYANQAAGKNIPAPNFTKPEIPDMTRPY